MRIINRPAFINERIIIICSVQSSNGTLLKGFTFEYRW